MGIPFSSTIWVGTGVIVGVKLGAGLGVRVGSILIVLVGVGGMAVTVAAGVGEGLGDGDIMSGGLVWVGGRVGAVVHPVASRISAQSHPGRASFHGLKVIAQIIVQST